MPPDSVRVRRGRSGSRNVDVAAVTQSEELSSSLFLSSAVAGGGGKDEGRLSGGHPVQVQLSLHPSPLTLLERQGAQWRSRRAQL